MTKRITYDMVEDLAVRARRVGHDVQLYFNYQGVVAVFHNGEEVLADEGRSYVVAEAKVRSILMNAEPLLEPDLKIVDKDVQRGKAGKAKKKKKPPTLKQMKKAKKGA